MTPHHYPLAPYAGVWPSPHQGLPYRTPASPLDPGRALVPRANDLMALGKLGAVIGLCGAGAASLRRLQADQITGAEALFHTLRTGVAAGLATATAGLVASQFRSPLASLVATVATGTAMMYVLGGETPDQLAPQRTVGEDA